MEGARRIRSREEETCGFVYYDEILYGHVLKRKENVIKDRGGSLVLI